MDRIMKERQLSSFMVSVGTGLGLESLFKPTHERIDDTKEIVEFDIDNIDILYVNIETLFRNIIESLGNIAVKVGFLKNMESPEYMVDMIIDEVNVIHNLSESVSHLSTILFIPDYSDVCRIHSCRHDVTENTMKLLYMDVLEKVKRFFHKDKSELELETINISHKLPSSNKRVGIFSHHGVDLLNVKSIRKLFLVESHTGKIKRSVDFNTKYHKIGDKNMSIFPFNERLIFLLGDREMAMPGKIKIRRAIYNLAINKNWTAFSSMERIDSGLKDISDEINYSKKRLLY